MTYLVTGGTGFIGRHVVEELLRSRRGTVFVLVRAGSRERFDRLHRTRWSSSARVVAVTGDLTAPSLGIDPTWIAAQAGAVRHVLHLAALYDMGVDDDRNHQINVEGTQAVIDLAAELRVRVLHHVSSVAVAGDYAGVFDETMFDVGQQLPSAYHATKFAAERLVRAQSAVPWRVYRPGIVVGHSETGAMDKIDGPYYFFPALKRLRDTLPAWVPLPAVELGDTNLVPVDYVAAALDRLAHTRGLDGRAFHLVSPTPQPTLQAVNAFASAAKAPRFVPVDRPLSLALPPALRPAPLLTGAVRSGAGQRALAETVGRLGIPAPVLGQLSFSCSFASRATEQALEGSDVVCPPLEDYASTLWDFWEQHLDTSSADDPQLRMALGGAKVVITGATSGIGKATALKVAQAGGTPLLVARGKDGLLETQTEIEALGGTASVYPCDLSDLDAIDRLTEQITADHQTVDVVVNNAGRSIRRSLHLSADRFHDFERTMQLNYFGAIRLVIGLLPAMRAAGGGHVVNISSIGVQTNPPRFSAYVASKAALDAWSRVVSSELVAEDIRFTTIHMPLVRTPMIAPTKIYDAFPTITPAQAADLVMRALKSRPHEINTPLGTFGQVSHALAPKAAFRVLNLAYRVFPDSPAARGDGPADETGAATPEQRLLARLLKGVHW